jgi:4-amino-4-deoxy-L-arabinose transferase-like glycosyltransferase
VTLAAPERPARRSLFSSEALREAGPPALALAALLVALATEFAITEDWDIPRPWLGFVPAALLLGGAALLMSRTRTHTEMTAAPIELTQRQEWLLLGGIVVLAAFFRLWHFYDFPQGIWFDEGMNAGDAIGLIERDHFVLWSDNVDGRATVYLYMLAGAFKVFGYNLFALRIVPVVAGFAAVVAFYFLARMLVGVVPALVATALLAVSRWATTFSRISWEAAVVPLFEIASVYFLLRALETKRRSFFALAGVSLAVGLYTYIAFRMVPVVLLMFLAYIAVLQWRLIARNIAGIAVYAAAFVVVVAPLAWFAINNQDRVLDRTRTVNVFREIDDKQSYEPLKFNIKANIKMMNVAGDRNPRHNIAGAPMLDEVTAALFVLGLAVSVWSLRDWRRGGIAIWYVLMLVPAALTLTLENPSAIRTIGAMPPLYLLVGMAVATTYRAIAPMRNGAAIFGAIALLLVGSSAAINYYDFFERQVKSEAVYDGFEPYYRQVGEAVARQDDDKHIFVSRAFDNHPAVKLLSHDKGIQPYVAAQDLIFPDDGRDAFLILDTTQFSMLPNLERLYPNVSSTDYVDPYGRVFFSEVTVPATDIASLHALRFWREVNEVDPVPLDHEWTEDDLKDGPFSVSWSGHIWINRFAEEVTFAAEGPGDMILDVDGQRFHGGLSLDATVSGLTYGEHEVELSVLVDRPGRVEMVVRQGDLSLAGTDALYTRSAGDHGFRVLHREDGTFSTPPTQIGRLPFATAAPPMNGTASVELQGMLLIPRAGVYGFALEGWNSVQLFVDGQLIVDNGGSHGMKRAEGKVDLGPGAHDVSIQYQAQTFPGWTLSWRQPDADWVPMDGSEFFVPTTPYVPPALVNLVPDASWGDAAYREINSIEHATGVAVLPSGEVVVAGRDRLAVLDASGNLLRTLRPNADDIVDIAATDDGLLGVLSRKDNAGVLLLLDAQGNEIRRITGEIASAGGVGASGNRLYVSSPLGGFVYAITLPDGAVETLGIMHDGPSARHASQPSDVAVGADGTLYLADFERKQVIAGTEAQPLREFNGATGTGGQLPRLATSGDLVFVSEGVAQRITILDREGKQRGVYVFPPSTQGVRPVGLAVDGEGRLYAADIEHGRVYRFQVQLPEPALPE